MQSIPTSEYRTSHGKKAALCPEEASYRLSAPAAAPWSRSQPRSIIRTALRMNHESDSPVARGAALSLSEARIASGKDPFAALHRVLHVHFLKPPPLSPEEMRGSRAAHPHMRTTYAASNPRQLDSQMEEFRFSFDEFGAWRRGFVSRDNMISGNEGEDPWGRCVKMGWRGVDAKDRERRWMRERRCERGRGWIDEAQSKWRIGCVREKEGKDMSVLVRSGRAQMRYVQREEKRSEAGEVLGEGDQNGWKRGDGRVGGRANGKGATRRKGNDHKGNGRTKYTTEEDARARVSGAGNGMACSRWDGDGDECGCGAQREGQWMDENGNGDENRMQGGMRRERGRRGKAGAEEATGATQRRGAGVAAMRMLDHDGKAEWMGSADCAGVHRFGCGRAGVAPTRLLTRHFCSRPPEPAALAGPAPHPARVVLAAPASGQRGTGWGCSGAARRARPQPEVERARAAVELVLMG
ncbi:hypothetical protein DFH09DRAFT_1289497 [Mycena vulgaris]|nr:hypothetical protein DFH09DRAFT_1289497 [Mycena vulgaris]